MLPETLNEGQVSYSPAAEDLPSLYVLAQARWRLKEALSKAL